jgi:hypothetical protein
MRRKIKENEKKETRKREEKIEKEINKMRGTLFRFEVILLNKQ